MEELLKLFDSFWYEHEILMKNPSLSPSPVTNPDRQIHQNDIVLKEEPKLFLPTLHVRSTSDQFLSSKMSFNSLESESPNSVLLTPKLQTILSGKEVLEFNEEPASKQEEKMEVNIKQSTDTRAEFSPDRQKQWYHVINCNFECNLIHEPNQSIKNVPIKKKESSMRSKRNKRKKNGSSKSLTDLEFEEVKGFMDLGFVFSEEDRGDSSLVSIIPGLQKLGRKLGGNDEKKQENFDGNNVVVSRPYLSEAWEVMDHKRKEGIINPLMNWRIPAVVNDLDMKDHLRSWAHTVASTVR